MIWIGFLPHSFKFGGTVGKLFNFCFNRVYLTYYGRVE